MSNSLPKPPLRELPRRIRMSAISVTRFLVTKPHYLSLALIAAIIFYELIFWSLNLGLGMYLLTAPFLSFDERLNIFISSFTSLFVQPTSWLGILLISVSIVQGISLSLLFYTIHSERRQVKAMIGSLGGTGIAGLLSMLGLGCAACGTSLITPVLTFFFATSSIAMAERAGEIAAILALLVALITLYLTGLKLPSLAKQTRW